MAQAITDFKGFLSDAKQIALELADLEREEQQAKEEEQRLLKALESEKKAVADNISLTVKRRREEINKSYDSEIAGAQDRLKKTRVRREKAKNQGIKERIKEETQNFIFITGAESQNENLISEGTRSVLLSERFLLCALFYQGI